MHYPRMDFLIFFSGPPVGSVIGGGLGAFRFGCSATGGEDFELCALLLRAWYRQSGTTVQELHHIAECTMETNS